MKQPAIFKNTGTYGFHWRVNEHDVCKTLLLDLLLTTADRKHRNTTTDVTVQQFASAEKL